MPCIWFEGQKLVLREWTLGDAVHPSIVMYHPTSDSDELDDYTQQQPANPGLALSEHPQVDRMRTMLSETLPYCCGTVELPAESYVLFYGKSQRAS